MKWSRAARRGGFKRGGFPIWTRFCPFLSFSVLFCPFLSFLGLSRFFWDFPDLSGGDSPGIFPIGPFPLSRLLTAPTRNSPERVCDTIWTFPEKCGKPPGLASLKMSQSSDLPLPHGLAPSETMVWDHGLKPPLRTENPGNKGFSGSGAPFVVFCLADPAPKG